MANIFRFKQFSVDQTGCAMKINTDGVLLAALAGETTMLSVLDIGTGTGVIALMLAQRFAQAQVDAVEIDEVAAATAAGNFKNSPFSERLTLFPIGFEGFFAAHPDKRYDLIVSNPPFYINSLQSPGAKKNLAKHAGKSFFDDLIKMVSIHLTEAGTCWLILPPETAELVKTLTSANNLRLQKIIKVCSFKHDAPHREILALGFDTNEFEDEELVIYDEPKVYSKQYQDMLREFLTIF
ncbi:tRNA1(Val) (adenine(37)-N6)-methyltransferase [Mucilaginibacter sp. SP1R1]|uniref:tRNA1(Val) (adenine(37)-N6)-methyltransferase n=1 Tax=Mucilaginibacter sp. SP1R1 TaxID=2723091 RepID=UPI00160A6F25|nr:methyltransferase [Mucilaginibacter sp. SP1R1]MBB6148093.1 tRNA1Val (adenine37-N6)-methyltransferase [Mucilaginibacter sp. SP1R1]